MSPARNPVATRTLERDTAAARRNLAMARAGKARADLDAWMNRSAIATRSARK